MAANKELLVLREAIEAAEVPFIVVFVHGPGGIGKSRFLQAMLDLLPPGIIRYVLDCRDIKPTTEGFPSCGSGESGRSTRRRQPGTYRRGLR